MNQLIGCCGLDCEACDARIATVTNDSALREKTAALWAAVSGFLLFAAVRSFSCRCSIWLRIGFRCRFDV